MIRKVLLCSLAAIVLLPFTTSCNKEEDTIAIITVVDTGGHPVSGAYVKLFANLAYPIGDPSRLFREGLTDASGRVEFDYTQQYKQGQAGFAVLTSPDIPAALVERPKMGFAVPIDSWLRGPLRDWAEMLLAPARLADGGLRPEPIQQAWREHLSGRRNWQYQLWTILMFQAWRERWESGGRRDPEGG